MQPIDIIIIVLAVLIVGGTIGYSLWKKKTGKGGCGCGCSGCSGCGNKSECPSAQNAEKEANEEQK